MIKRSSKKPGYRKGFSMIITVVAIGILTLGMMTIAFRSTVRTLETQRQVQLQIDYEAREQGFLRALVSLAPVYAANTMMEDSRRSSFKKNVQFEYMYEEAGEMANMEKGLDGVTAEALGIGPDVKSANVADTSYDSAADYVGAYDNGRARTLGAVQGTSSGAYPPPMYVRGLTGSGFSARPNSVDSSSRNYARVAPLLSSAVTYRTTGSEHPDLKASASDYPLYNLIPYPNIHFGYGKPGELIVAKHNWWRIFMHPEVKDMANTGLNRENQSGGLGYVDREYILSIIEIPAQLAISSSTVTKLGEFTNGSAWKNITIQGSVYGDKVIARGDFSADRIASRKGVQLEGSASAGSGDERVTSSSTKNREEFEAGTSEFFPVSKSSDTARAMFVSLNRGEEFFDRFATEGLFDEDPGGGKGRRYSYENWHYYTAGCNQCAMRLDVIGVVDEDNQTPMSFRFSYLSGGERVEQIYSRYDGTWPAESSEAGETFPIQMEILPDGRIGLRLDLKMLVDAMATLTPAPDGFDVNHSLVVNADYNQRDVLKPSVSPTSNSDIALVLRGAEDLTPFPKGFSLVTNFRTYIAEDVNTVETTPPAGSGIATPFYPPFSLYCPEKRFGLDGANTSIDMTGSVGTLGTNDSSGIGVVDWKLGGSNNVDPNRIKATLKPITHPGALPPINMVNWLVLVQRVQDAEFDDY